MSDIYLYGGVGTDFDASTLRDKFAASKDNLVTVHINSYGGDVFEGVAISSLIRAERSKGRTVVVQIDGLAASAASYMGLTASDVVMCPGAMMMIHNPAAACFGNAEEMRKTARSLDQCRESIVRLYQWKTGLDSDGIRLSMDAETWLTAEEAVELSLCDRIDTSLPPIEPFTPHNKIANSNLKNMPFKRVKKRGYTPSITEPVENKPDAQDAPSAQDDASAHVLFIGGAVYTRGDEHV